jgi:hypothetical protein
LVQQKILTGHIPKDEGTRRVRDILIYDIPVSWSPEKILAELNLWGKTISIHCKPQKKYQTVRIKIELTSFKFAQFEGTYPTVWTTDLGGIPVRWFNARWNLRERKQREKFQAVVRNLPDTINLQSLWHDRHPHEAIIKSGLKSFKIIQNARTKDRKLIGYFESWDLMRAALDTPFNYEGLTLPWSRSDPPKQQKKLGDKSTSAANVAGSKPKGTLKTSSKKENTSSTKVSRSKKNSEKTNKSTKKSKNDKSKKSKKDKQSDKSRKGSKEQLLAGILDALRKLI